jgi:hypothetical protein
MDYRHIARYNGIAAFRHLNVLHEDGLAAIYTYAVNRKQRLRRPASCGPQRSISGLSRRFIQGHAELFHCDAMTGCHLMADHLFERVRRLSGLGSIYGRFGDARPNACGEFDTMLAGDDPDHVRLVLEPVPRYDSDCSRCSVRKR